MNAIVREMNAIVRKTPHEMPSSEAGGRRPRRRWRADLNQTADNVRQISGKFKI